MNAWKCKLIFPDTLQQKIEITDLKYFFMISIVSIVCIWSLAVWWPARRSALVFCWFGSWCCGTVCLMVAVRWVHGSGGRSLWWSSVLSSHIAGCRCPGGRGKLSRLNYSLQGFPVESGAVPVPGGDAASQDALHGATVELSEDFWALTEFLQSPEEEETLVGLRHYWLT